MKNAIVLSLVSCLALAGAARAEDEKKPDAKMEMPTAGPEHKKLGYFVGSWSLEGEMKSFGSMPGGKMKMTSKCSWFQGGYAVVCNDQGSTPMGPMKSMGVLSYDREDKKYRYFGMDSTGMAENAEGSVENDVWTYTNESKMNGQTFKGRYTMSNLEPASYQFKWEMSQDGTTWSTMADGTYRRMGAKPAAAAAGKKPATGEKAEAAPDKK